MLTIYSKPGCSACVNAKIWLATNNITFTEVDVSKNDEAKEKMLTEGLRTVPQIWIGDKLLPGGYAGLAKLTPDEVRAALSRA